MCQTPKNEAETAGFRRGRPVALSAEERRTEIFAALESIYEDAGLDGATMDCLAKRAAMSKRTLYALYASRDQLLGAGVTACERFYPAFQLTCWGNRSPKESIGIAIAEAYGRA